MADAVATTAYLSWCYDSEQESGAWEADTSHRAETRGMRSARLAEIGKMVGATITLPSTVALILDRWFLGGA